MKQTPDRGGRAIPRSRLGFVLAVVAVAYGTVYVASSTFLYALDAATGALRWKIQAGGATADSPVVANGLVYYAATDDHVRAIDARTGVVLWTYVIGGYAGRAPAVAVTPRL